MANPTEPSEEDQDFPVTMEEWQTLEAAGSSSTHHQQALAPVSHTSVSFPRFWPHVGHATESGRPMALPRSKTESGNQSNTGFGSTLLLRSVELPARIAQMTPSENLAPIDILTDTTLPSTQQSSIGAFYPQSHTQDLFLQYSLAYHAGQYDLASDWQTPMSYQPLPAISHQYFASDINQQSVQQSTHMQYRSWQPHQQLLNQVPFLQTSNLLLSSTIAPSDFLSALSGYGGSSLLLGSLSQETLRPLEFAGSGPLLPQASVSAGPRQLPPYYTIDHAHHTSLRQPLRSLSRACAAPEGRLDPPATPQNVDHGLRQQRSYARQEQRHGLAQPSSSRYHGKNLLRQLQRRSVNARTYSLREVEGSVESFAVDPLGSRFLQDKLDKATPDEIETLMSEALPSILKLSKDPYGNYVSVLLSARVALAKVARARSTKHATSLKVIQRLLELCSSKEWDDFYHATSNHILELSLNKSGCRVVQKALDLAGTEKKVLMAQELKGHIIRCVRDENANHVICKIFQKLAKHDVVSVFLQEVHGNAAELSILKHGCHVLQKCFECCDSNLSSPLINEILQEVRKLVSDEFGNYVIQHVLRYGELAHKQKIIETGLQNLWAFATQKHASNVVERMIELATSQQRAAFIEKLLDPLHDESDTLGLSGDDERNIVLAVDMMRDPYANYVLKTMYRHANREQRLHIAIPLRAAIDESRTSLRLSTQEQSIERMLNANTLFAQQDAGARQMR